jgi:CRISPR/Cas system-associated endoribonuclease Cas2
MPTPSDKNVEAITGKVRVRIPEMVYEIALSSNFYDRDEDDVETLDDMVELEKVAVREGGGWLQYVFECDLEPKDFDDSKIEWTIVEPEDVD